MLAELAEPAEPRLGGRQVPAAEMLEEGPGLKAGAEAGRGEAKAPEGPEEDTGATAEAEAAAEAEAGAEAMAKAEAITAAAEVVDPQAESTTGPAP